MSLGTNILQLANMTCTPISVFSPKIIMPEREQSQKGQVLNFVSQRIMMKFQKPKSRSAESNATAKMSKPSMSSSSGEDEDQLPQLDCGLGDTELVFMTEQLNRLRSREKRVRVTSYHSDSHWD